MEEFIHSLHLLVIALIIYYACFSIEMPASSTLY